MSIIREWESLNVTKLSESESIDELASFQPPKRSAGGSRNRRFSYRFTSLVFEEDDVAVILDERALRERSPKSIECGLFDQFVVSNGVRTQNQFD